jgi:prepilin-type N-terminal cleavage/methylation domain-containing protein/prepilin-type processing-associated H-X9-DG protein
MAALPRLKIFWRFGPVVVSCFQFLKMRIGVKGTWKLLRSCRGGAFTLVELLVVIAIIGILSAMLLPVLSKSKQTAQSLDCINNLKQLEECCHLYTADFDDFLVLNQVGANVGANPSPTNSFSTNPNADSWCPGLAPLDTNTVNVESGLLYPYNKSVAIYHCPADQSTVSNYPTMLRTRSYCMDISLACSSANSTFSKYTQINGPSPDELFVLIDDQEEDIWDATFGIFAPGGYYSDYWLDLPADRHRQGANLSFADGHVEHWRWRARKILDFSFEPCYDPDDYADLQRLQQCIKPGVY